jgi:hypothetical protein
MGEMPEGGSMSKKIYWGPFLVIHAALLVLGLGIGSVIMKFMEDYDPQWTALAILVLILASLPVRTKLRPMWNKN